MKIFRMLVLLILVISCSKGDSLNGKTSNPNFIESFNFSHDLAHLSSYRNYIHGINGDMGDTTHIFEHTFISGENLHKIEIWKKQSDDFAGTELCESNTYAEYSNCIVDFLFDNKTAKTTEYYCNDDHVWKMVEQ